MTAETFVHPAAVVEAGAQLGAGVHIGPFCHIGAESVVGDSVRMASHVTITGATYIGAGCQIFQNAVLGGAPQSVRHKGGRTTLSIGASCIIREGVTFNVGTDSSTGATTIGSNGFFMAQSHVAHDCVVGDNVTMANGAVLGGHCEVGDFVTFGGLSAVHQFVRIGHHAFIGGLSGVERDVIPYGMVTGDRAKLRGLNVIGIKRSGYSRADLLALRSAYRMLFASGRALADAIPLVAEKYPDSAAIADMLSFLQVSGKRHFTMPAAQDRGGGDDEA
ncbi:acyl-ACP--UDP-N-acetylglucosamine O-acyltransferase [Aliihoeflea aestuarii]|jgi:UDP-N-acetylglucosamine acyltransferase|uniref:acyl-ACP--UDP-N-acetylglucosamine O-acyltransferase n=1 Tax=Aliihoeflea aestuarii TaxID=453840 RepID=UPI0020930B75|nr:acyl-ACP--UDP-N-acetylglucosamine O-acyltransferase [Aliihoeflea aestuarii]MCO6390386.1 acyl-ACP--UDP-N-acetylglucosamine O-acyltransferase [Aliihoeflea aestuarii]